jgi:hypothetical protein
MATTIERILQSGGLEAAVSLVAPREMGITTDTERPVIGSTVGGTKFIGTEDLINIITAAPSPLALLRRSRVMCFVDTQAAGANVALDIQAGAQSSGYSIKVFVSGPSTRKAVVTYGTGLTEDIPAYLSQEFIWDGAKWNKTILSSSSLATLFTNAAAPRGYIDGLILSNDAGDVDHDIAIAAGISRDSTNVIALALAAAITKRLDAAWAAGTGNGGIDTGSIGASAVYYVWLIRKDSDASIDALFSLSATAPTMPAGYTYKRRIGTMLTDGSSNIRGFVQIGDEFIYKSPVQDKAYSANLASTNRIGYVLTAPPLMKALVNILAMNNNGGADLTLWYGNSSRTDAAASMTNLDMHFMGNYSTCDDTRQILLDSNKQIYMRGSNIVIWVQLNTIGWIDDRGRNA